MGKGRPRAGRDHWAALSLAALAAWGLAAQGRSAEIWRFPPFGPVTLYAPERPPEQVVLFLSGDGGWNLGVIPMAERLRDLGALVVGIDIRVFQRALESGGGCAYPAGALEELARAVQLYARLPAYKRPILVGYSSGATLVYAALAAAPVETFAGGISLGFCPDIEMRKSPCRGRLLEHHPRTRGVGYDLAVAPNLGVPWMVLQGDIDQVCGADATRRFVEQIPSARLFWLPKVGHGFGVTRRWDAAYVEAYQTLSRAPANLDIRPAVADAVADLPLIEVPAERPEGDVFAVMLSGDGGWAEIDKGVSAELARRGVPVVGWSSLKYFWKPRTPEGAATDLARVIEHYRRAWGKRRVLLVGYSFGADVLPFMATRLSAATRDGLIGLGLIGLSTNATFEFHVSSWLTSGGDARFPTAPEVDRLGLAAVCLVGTEEHDSACPATHARVVTLPGGHHFGGDYSRVGREIVELARSPHRGPVQ